MNIIKMLPEILRASGEAMKKNSPVIFTGIAAIGAVASPALAALGTVKAVRKIDKLKKEKEAWSLKDTVKAAWPYYISPAIVTGITLTGIFGSNHIRAHREAALIAAASFAETTLDDFKKKAPEIVGEKKATEIEDAVAGEQLARNPLVNNEQIVVTGTGNTLCYDPLSGRYFRQDIEILRRIEKDLNHSMLLGDDYVSLNQFYYEVGLDETVIGNDIGWNVNRSKGRLIKLKFSTMLSATNEPCLVVGFEDPPRYEFNTSEW